jgi:hypothetical protein
MDDQWVEVQRGRIREAFALFDKDRKGEYVLCYTGPAAASEAQRSALRRELHHKHLMVC